MRDEVAAAAAEEEATPQQQRGRKGKRERKGEPENRLN